MFVLLMAEQEFLVFFPCYYKENSFRNNACGNHKSEAPKKTRLHETHLYLIWHCFNKTKTVVHGLDSQLHPKKKQKGLGKRQRQMISNAFDLGPNSKETPDKSVSQRKGTV